MNKISIFHGVGRRKSSVARVWVRRGKGNVLVNGRPHGEYFDTDTTRAVALAPLVALEKSKDFDIKVNIYGGGLVSQAGAVRLGIARALLSSDEELRAVLKKEGFLRVDSRVKERKKYGQRGARAKFQFVKR